MKYASPLEIALMVAEAFEDLEIPYLICGSLASAIHGEARSTQDVDFVAELTVEQVINFARRLEDRFDIDVEQVRSAIRDHASFNIFFRAMIFKIDIYVPSADPLDRAQIEHRQREKLLDGPERWAYILSAEDSVLQKLRWYRIGGEVSDRQWRDVVGVIKVQAARLDLEYLRRMSTASGFADILERALREAGVRI